MAADIDWKSNPRLARYRVARARSFCSTKFFRRNFFPRASSARVAGSSSCSTTIASLATSEGTPFRNISASIRARPHDLLSSPLRTMSSAKRSSLWYPRSISFWIASSIQLSSSVLLRILVRRFFSEVSPNFARYQSPYCSTSGGPSAGRGPCRFFRC